MNTQQQPQNLMEAVIAECNRCRALVREYEAIGPAGFFGATVIGAGIVEAERAMESGDVVALLRAYEDLRGYE